MKVHELITELGKYDPNLDVLFQQFSDYSELKAEQIMIEKAIHRPSAMYYQRVDSFMTPEYMKDAIDCLVFPGN